MLRNSESRVMFFGSVVLCSLLLVILGAWGISGVFGIITLGAAIVVNGAAVLFSPSIEDGFKESEFWGWLAVAALVSTPIGCIAFGWWGLAYTVGALSGYLLAASFRRSKLQK